MKSGKLNKMATILAVLFLVMSGLMVVQWNAQPVEATEHEDEDYTYTIDGFIETDYIEESLEIKLRSLSTDEIEEVEYTSNYHYEFTDVKPGWYEIIVPSQIEDGYAYMKNRTDPFRVPEEDVEIPSEINIDTKIIEESLEGNITDSAGDPIEDALVTIEDKDGNFIHSVYTEMKEEDNETHSSFEIDIYGDFEGTLKVEKENYAPFINTTISLVDYDITTFDVELSRRPVIEGNLVDQNGVGIKEKMDITLYNESVGVLHTTKEGPTFRIRAPENRSYILIVSAPGYEPLLINEDEIGELEKGERRWLGNREVAESEPEEIHTDIDFGDDVNDLKVETTRSIRNNTRIETMEHPFIGNLAMQIGLALGEEETLDLSRSDIEEFKERLNYTKDIHYTPEFITVNDTVYELTNYTAEFSEGFEENLTGPVTDLFEGEIYFNTTREYTLADNIGPSGRHIIDLTVDHDRIYGNRREYTYEMTLRDGHERYRGEGTEEDIPGNVEIDGYTELTIDPEMVEPGEDLRSKVTLDIRRSKAGEVLIDVDPDDDVRPYIFEKEEDEDVDWVIKKGTEVMFRADYTPETSEAINYNWTYGDTEEDGEDLTEFNYTFDVAEEKELKLTVLESSGADISDSINIVVDDEGPWGDHIIVNEENITLGDSTSVDEQEEVEFSASDFHDNSTGVVAEYKWTFNYTEENEEAQDEGENVTHAFDVPGEYKVSLNVSDIVGNWRIVSIDVTVMDVTEPEGDFSIEWNDNSTYEPTVRLQKETIVTFNGTEIVAHPEYNGELVEFNWTLIDEDTNETLAEREEAVWNYTDFNEAGTYIIRLNVTDGPSGFTEEGKENYRIIEKTIIIDRGPVPNLRVQELWFSDENPRVGDTVTINVNVTNVGDSKAEDIDTILRVNGERVDIDERFYQDGEEMDVHEIAQGESVTIRFEWEPEEDGENTINVNVTDAVEGEYEDLLYDNEMEDTINVRAPAWRQYLVYALIPIIIIGVTVGLYFFKDKLADLLG